MSDKMNLQQLLRKRAITEDMPQNVVQSQQSTQSQQPAVAPNKSARGEVTMDKFIEDIRYLFDEGEQLGIDKQGVVGHVVRTAQEKLQAEKQQSAPIQSSATGTAITRQFTGESPAAPKQPADNAASTLPSGPSR
ncbi:MAG: hypothetical protein WC748_04615 [Legionellales bacterium]|jgi:hypothetical protein